MISFLNFFSLFFWSVLLLYFIIIIISWIGWIRISTNRKELFYHPINVSVIIAARNEELKIPALIHDLNQQDYPKSNTEIILIDDHSEIPLSSLKCFTSVTEEHIRIITLDDAYVGKKAALRAGFEKSNGELLIFTDADCRVGPSWIKSIVEHYKTYNSSLIIGLVNQTHFKGFWAHFSRFDLMSLIITGAGLASIGFPVMCNGANLAVKREVYSRYIGSLRSDIASGDDIFLLHAIKKERSSIIRVLKSKEASVHTEAPSDLTEFLGQRTRWASKSWNYNDLNTTFLALIVLFANAGLIYFAINAIIFGEYLKMVGSLTAKIIADGLIIATGIIFFGNRRSSFWYPIFSLIYPFYVLLVFFCSLFRTYSWKGRIV